MKRMKKTAVYTAAAAITAAMSIAAPVPASAAVRMFVVNGNTNGNVNTNGNFNGSCFGGGSQNINLSDVLSSLCGSLPSSFPVCGNQMSEVDILRPNLPNNSCLIPDAFNQNGWWGCPDQSQFGQNCPSQNQPDWNQPDVNCPSQNCPDQNQPGQPSQPDKPTNPNQPSQGGSTNTSYAQQVINLVNEERAKAGLASVQSVDSITQAANVRAQEIVTNFSHTRPDGSSFSTALRQAGVSYMGSGENIAYGQRTPEEVMDGWMNSSGHRANILNPNYKNIGIGFYEANGVKYWVQLFTY